MKYCVLAHKIEANLKTHTKSGFTSGILVFENNLLSRVAGKRYALEAFANFAQFKALTF